MRKMKKNREKMYRSRWTKIVSYILVTVMTVSLFGQIAANGTFGGTGKQAGTGMIAGFNQVEAASDASIDYKTILEETSVAIEKKLTTYKVEVADETGGTSIVDWYGPANASIGGSFLISHISNHLRCLYASYARRVADIAAFNDSTCPAIGIRSRRSAFDDNSSVSPFPSFPIRNALFLLSFPAYRSHPSKCAP